MVKADSKAAEPLIVLEEPGETKQVVKATANQETSPVFPLDEALLEAFVEVAGLRHAGSARKPELKPMRCYACRDTTDERCSYCLLPVCHEHGGRIKPWFTRQYVMVCTTCQARLRDIAWLEQNL